MGDTFGDEIILPVKRFDNEMNFLLLIIDHIGDNR